MEQPMFYQGQRVVCVDSSGVSNNGLPNPLIEGKPYIVSNPNSKHPRANGITIQLSGFPQGLSGYHFAQLRFVSPETDQELSDEITEALNEDLKVKL